MRKTYVTLVAFALTVALSHAEDNMAMLKREGLRGRVTYRVIDEAGVPVTNADVSVYFNNLKKGSEVTVAGKTDTNGLFSAEARVKYDSMATVTKGGYYESWKRYMFFTIDQSRMKNGKWLPWNPMVEITLHPRIQPNHDSGEFKMRVLHHLEQNTDYGFDMLRKDIVMPGKKGETADFLFRGIGLYKVMSGEEPRDTKIFYTNDLEVAFQNEGDGVIRMKKHFDSVFQFTYLAPEIGYEQKVRFHSDYSREGHVSTFPSDDEYLIFRISRKDEETGEEKRYYGIITRLCGGADIKGEFEVSIEYCLNPTPGDRNIEYGP